MADQRPAVDNCCTHGKDFTLKFAALVFILLSSLNTKPVNKKLMAFKKSNDAFVLVNLITGSRIGFSIVLFLMAWFHYFNAFKWILAISFLTDALDGFLARLWQVTSTLGAKLDSWGDDANIVAAIVGIYVFIPGFITWQLDTIISLIAIFSFQTILSFIRYKKMSSFHTYGAKCAAVLQAAFLITLFFYGPVLWLFYTMTIVTALELIEEAILVTMIPAWTVNVKGIYWHLKDLEKTAG